MTDPFGWATLIAVALVAGAIGGTVGFGGSLLLLPACAYAFGPAAAVPIMTVAALIGNLSRWGFSLRDTDWRIAAWYIAGAVPGAASGALVYVDLDPEAIKRFIGAATILAVPARRLLAARRIRMAPPRFAVLGAAMGFASGIVGAVGPINAPFFLAAGLVKGAYLATEAFGAAAVHLTKTTVYGRYAALTPDLAWKGVAVGAGLTAGSFVGKQFVARLDARTFTHLVEGLLIVAGAAMIAGL